MGILPMKVGMGVRSIAMSQGRMGFRVHLLAGAIIAGFALGFATTSHAAPGTTTATAESEAPGRPVKLNTFNKRSTKQAIVVKRKVVAKTTAINSKYVTKRGAKYSRIASRVQKASQKFQKASQTYNVAADASTPPKQQQPRTPSAVSTSAGDSLKPLVADARAEMSAADLKVAGGSAAPFVVADAAASDAPRQVAAADQFNDIDRAAAAANEVANGRPGQILKPVSPQRAAFVSNDSAWDQTSWIGKLFVAFGGILTLASAARMFMA